MKTLLIVTASMFSAASAFGATEEAELKALSEYCKPDVERLCKGVDFGGGAVKACLQKHEKEISVGCAQALQALKQK